MECKRAREGQRGAHDACMCAWQARERGGGERAIERGCSLPLMFSALLHHQCLTSVAPAWPPRDESITLNNVNVSPSQHKTNNHRSLPVLRARGLRNPRPLVPFPLLFLFAFTAFRPRRGFVKKSPFPPVSAAEPCFVNGDARLFIATHIRVAPHDMFLFLAFANVFFF